MSNPKAKKTFGKNQSLSKQISKMSETYPNQNIYQGDFDYKMMKSLKFEQENDENNCQRSVIIRYVNSLHAIIIYSILKNLFDMTQESNLSAWYLLLRCLTIICLMISFLIVANIDKFIKSITHLRWFMEFDILVSIFISANTSEFPFTSVTLKIVQSSVQSCLFNLNMSQTLIFYYLETLVCLIFIGSHDNYFPSRFFNNITSSNGLWIVAIPACHLFCQYFFSKAQRELWALYDSFRRSFFTLKNICDEVPFPILIVSRKKQITQNNPQNISFSYYTHYKNNEAEKLNLKIKRLRGTNSKTTNLYRSGVKSDFNFKDLFEKSVEKLLDREIEKCLLNDLNYFDFPLFIGDQDLHYKENENFPTIFEGSLEMIKWVRIIVNPVVWKGSECFMFQIMENTDIKYSQFTEEFVGLINNEFIKVLENVDNICEKAPDVKRREERKSPVNSNPHSRKNSGTFEGVELTKTPEIKNRNVPRSPVISTGEQLNKSPLKQSPEKLGRFLQVPKQQFNIGENLNNRTNQHHSMSRIDFPAQAPLEKSQFDYSLLFYLKNSFNYMYDIYLTINILNSLRINKGQRKLTQFHFENFLFYLIDYLHPFLKSKNIKFKLNSQIEELNAIYDYYRVIFFNTILFILNNTEQQEEEMEIKIYAEHSKFTEQGSYYEIVFYITDENPKVKYNLIADLLSSFKVTELRNCKIENYKIIDVGLVVSSHIVSAIYNSEYKITSVGNKHKICFGIYGHEADNTQQMKRFSRRGSEFEEKFYCPLVKIYKENKALRNLVKEGSWKNVLKQKNANLKQVENGDVSEEDIVYPLAQDFHQYKDLHLFMHNKFDFEDKLLLIVEEDQKFEEIKNNSVRMKLIPESPSKNQKKTKFFAKWQNMLQKEIKYFPIPRFLIVEDNLVGRMSIKDELKRLKLDHRYDIAADGREAVYKFKILLNQGYIFDFIFMDIYLPEMGGNEATRNIRNLESTYNVHSNIVAVTVEGKKELEEGIFDEYFEKPIKNSDKFFSYISMHFKKNRPEIALKDLSG